MECHPRCERPAKGGQGVTQRLMSGGGWGTHREPRALPLFWTRGLGCSQRPVKHTPAVAVTSSECLPCSVRPSGRGVFSLTQAGPFKGAGIWFL